MADSVTTDESGSNGAQDGTSDDGNTASSDSGNPGNDAPETASGAVDLASESRDSQPGDSGDDSGVAADGSKPAELAGAPNEEALKKAAVKYANSTMAAARRALRQIERNKAAEESFKTKYGEVESERNTLKELIAEWATDPISALPKLSRLAGVGEEDFKQLLERATYGLTGKSKPTAEDRVAALEAKLAEKETAAETARKTAEAEAEVKASQGRLYEALGKDDRFDLVVNTQRGREEIWDAIYEYARINKVVPDAKVYELAVKVETALAADLKGSKKLRLASDGKNDAPSNGNAGAARASNGKTVTNNSGTDPVKRKPLPEDEDSARMQVLRELGFV